MAPQQFLPNSFLFISILWNFDSGAHLSEHSPFFFLFLVAQTLLDSQKNANSEKKKKSSFSTDEQKGGLMARQQAGTNNGKSINGDKMYTPVSTMKTVGAAPAATNKSPRKSQKHNNRLDSNGRSSGNLQNGGANRNASTVPGVNKRDVWRLTSTKQNSRAEYSSSEDLATCSKGRLRP